MSVLKRKIQAASGAEDQRALRAWLSSFLADHVAQTQTLLVAAPGWTSRLAKADFIGADQLDLSQTPSALIHGFGSAPTSQTICLCVPGDVASRLTTIALNQGDDGRAPGAFELHFLKTFAEALRRKMMQADINLSHWLPSLKVGDLNWPVGTDSVFRTRFLLIPPGYENAQMGGSKSEYEGPLNFEIYLTLACCVALHEAFRVPERQPPSRIEDQEAEQDLRNRLGCLKVPMRAVATQVSLTIADCTRLQIGQVIAAPRLNLDTVSLRIAASHGTEQIVRGRFGMDQGSKAVQLCQPIDPAFLKQSLKAASQVEKTPNSIHIEQ
jgi:hypothetical protein